MTDVDRRSAGRLMASTALFKNLIFIKCFGFSAKILGISNGNYIDTLLSKKMFSFKINKLSTTDNILDGKPCGVLYIGYLNKDISFGDIVYFEPKNVQYKKLVIGTIDQLSIVGRRRW